MPTQTSMQKRIRSLWRRRRRWRMLNCKSYIISILRFCFIILLSNSYSRICITFFFSQDLTTIHLTRILSRQLSLRVVLVNRQVMKLTMRTNYMRKTTKMFELLVKNQMRIPCLSVFRPLLEDMLVKITILYVITLAPILLVLPVIWPWIMIPHWAPSVSTLYCVYIFVYINCYILILKSRFQFV